MHRKPIADRFWAKVDLRSEDDCWEWQASRNPAGYGQINSGGRNGRCLGAHRVAYDLFFGPIPDGHELHHVCCNRACVNPAHLMLVTAMTHPDTAAGIARAKTHCVHGHPLDDASTYKAPRRHCRECNRIRVRAHKQVVLAARREAKRAREAATRWNPDAVIEHLPEEEVPDGG